MGDNIKKRKKSVGGGGIREQTGMSAFMDSGRNREHRLGLYGPVPMKAQTMYIGAVMG